MVKSFKPGLSQNERISLQQQTDFYSRKFGTDYEPVELEDNAQEANEINKIIRTNRSQQRKPQTAGDANGRSRFRSNRQNREQ